jgi:hypothetical protein
MRREDCFVFAVAGEKHVRQADLAISFLKRVTKCDIVLVHARSQYLPDHDQVMIADTPAGLTDHQAGIFLKTNLADIIGAGTTFCYLDSDVIAVSRDVDDIFAQKRGPIAFAADHARIDVFSRHAVNCFCSAPPCSHLRDRIAYDFGIRITNPDWPMWNGGVFVCGSEGYAFMRHWHQRVLQVFNNPFWRTRDQGALAATAWQLGMQGQTTLESRFNLIVDRFKGVPDPSRGALPLDQYTVRSDYQLHPQNGKPAPAFLHFINGGMGRTGWRNWDDIAAYHAQRLPA